MADSLARAEIRDRHIADLRDALARVVPLRAFSAGQLAADDPEFAEGLTATADEMTKILTRTAPA